MILCGGSGTRLWPLSRAGFPKQFLAISGMTTLFQQAVDRINAIASNDIFVAETLVVTGEEHRFIALEQIREMASVSAKLLLESEGKNTAPALTLAALQALKNGDDPVLVVTPADQTVQNQKAFVDAIERSVKLADAGAIVILGIKPTGADTGFGYRLKLQSRLTNMNVVYNYLLILGLITSVLDFGLLKLRKNLCKWFDKE